MDDSGPPATSVIPAKAGTQPRWVGLIGIAGLLVLMGAGCSNEVSKTDAPVAYTEREMSIIAQERETAQKNMSEYAYGVHSSCQSILNYSSINLEPVERMFSSKIDDQPLQDFLKEHDADHEPTTICAETVPTRDGDEAVMYFQGGSTTSVRMGFWKIGDATVTVSDAIPLTAEKGYLDNLRLTYTAVSPTKNAYTLMGNEIFYGGPYDDTGYIKIYEFNPSTKALKKRECDFVAGQDPNKACAKFF